MEKIPTILIAEDATHVRRACSVILREHGYRVIEAEDGQEAVVQYVKHHPNVTLLDINMPVLDGLSALTRIKQLDPNARVVMLTALGEKDKVVAAIRAGAQDYVVKPFRVERVLQAVRTLLSTALDKSVSD